MDTELNADAVSPAIRPGPLAVTIVTPLAQDDRPSRKSCVSTLGGEVDIAAENLPGDDAPRTKLAANRACSSVVRAGDS